MNKEDIIITLVAITAIIILIYIIIWISGPPPTPPPSGWTVYQNKTGGKILDAISGNFDTIKNACLANSSCAGFSTNGDLLQSIQNPEFLVDSQYNLYVQTPPPPSGYQIYPKSSSGNSYNVVGGGPPPYIASQCRGGMCSGFLSDGTLVTSLTNPSFFTPGQYDLYVKDTVVPKGYKLYPKSTSGNNFDSTGGGLPEWIAQYCNRESGCNGFTSDGTLLSGVGKPSQFKPSQFDLYIKS